VAIGCVKGSNTKMAVRFLLAGDGGLVLEFGAEVDVAVNNRVRALALTLEAARIPGCWRWFPRIACWGCSTIRRG
jgi:hypothetical protein